MKTSVKCRRYLSALSIIAFMIGLPAVSFAQTSADSIEAGSTWLLNARYGFGTWAFDAQPDPMQSEFTVDDYRKTYVRDTLAAADALQALNIPPEDYQLTINWVQLFPFDSISQIAEKTRILSKANLDVTLTVTSLLSSRNSDGGFSGAKGYPVSNILDTALALQALKEANYSDTTLIGQSLNYLTTKQNTDGGWGFSANDESNTYITSVVLRTLAAYNSVFINQNSINNAATFLLAKQTENNDGGFGSSPSTVYETALSLMSLIESGQGSAQQLQNAVNYLTSAQSTTNGSWNDDPYSTALALQALASARANLAVSSADISLSKSMPQENEAVTITATIRNIGLDSASNVAVRFYLGDPSSGGVQIGTDQALQLIAPGSSAQATIMASFTGTGGKTIYVVVDPDNSVSETSEADNTTTARVWVSTGPDLAVYSEDLKPATYVPAAGTAFTLEYTVRNLGESLADGFDVALYDGDPGAGGQVVPLQVIHISGLNGTEVRTDTFGVTLTGDGPHTLYLVADSGNALTELSETNNTGSVTVTVGGTQTGADLIVTSADITLNPSRPTAGQTVAISAKVRNQGLEPADSFLVEIYDGAPESAGVFIASQTVSLAAGAEQTVSTNWTSTTGIHDIYAVVDRMNGLAESDESNNSASVRVMTDMVDISLSATDLVFNPAYLA